MPRKIWPVVAGGAVLAAAVWVWRDYDAWLALGPGGLPATPTGWLKMTRLRLQARNPFNIADLGSAMCRPDAGAWLADLPKRCGPRPRVSPHPVPHRQLTGHAAPAMKAALREAFQSCVAASPTTLDYALSHFEKHNHAVTLRRELCCNVDAHAGHGEIGHIHPSDGSMHMIFSPADAVSVVQAGWGELHGCAGRALGLPATYTLIYAPRSLADIAVIRRLLDAAVGHISSARVSSVADRP